eukprot:SAG31_NODE_43303_length_267_cov_1.511905_1_plen_33_part_01
MAIRSPRAGYLATKLKLKLVAIEARAFLIPLPL